MPWILTGDGTANSPFWKRAPSCIEFICSRAWWRHTLDLTGDGTANSPFWDSGQRARDIPKNEKGTLSHRESRLWKESGAPYYFIQLKTQFLIINNKIWAKNKINRSIIKLYYKLHFQEESSTIPNFIEFTKKKMFKKKTTNQNF